MPMDFLIRPAVYTYIFIMKYLLKIITRDLHCLFFGFNVGFILQIYDLVI